ncbi:MAG: DUF4163 domain-containing protein [Erythrobacter sp.]
MMRYLALALAIAGGLGSATLGPDGEHSAAAQDAAAADGENSAEAKIGRYKFGSMERLGKATREFRYDWPEEASEIPGLVAILEKRGAEEFASTAREWRSAVVEFAGSDCESCVNWSHATDWEVGADTARFLSMGAEKYRYSGGAHGMMSFEVLLWDREADGGAGAQLDPIDLFVSKRALEDTVRPTFCAMLKDLQKERRGDAYRADDEIFGKCPEMDRLVMIPFSTNEGSLNELSFLAGPYVAGPYVEGTYQVQVPVTQGVIEAVKPQYREAFAVAGQDAGQD